MWVLSSQPLVQKGRCQLASSWKWVPEPSPEPFTCSPVRLFTCSAPQKQVFARTLEGVQL